MKDKKVSTSTFGTKSKTAAFATPNPKNPFMKPLGAPKFGENSFQQALREKEKHRSPEQG
jgi:hypothetical protein